MESKEKVAVKIVTDTSELDEACAKAERLKSCLQEAMELAHSIASLAFTRGGKWSMIKLRWDGVVN